jgi:hypothetical protein
MKKIIIIMIVILTIMIIGVIGINLLVNKSRGKPCSSCLKSKDSKTKIIGDVPLPQEEDIVRNFFALIEEKLPPTAVSMMSELITKDEAQKQNLAVKFNAIDSIKVIKIEPLMTEKWTDLEHIYKLTLSVQLNTNVNGISDFDWVDGENIQSITIVKENNLWKIKKLIIIP